MAPDPNVRLDRLPLFRLSQKSKESFAGVELVVGFPFQDLQLEEIGSNAFRNVIVDDSR
jgi:hypothetical protein